MDAPLVARPIFFPQNLFQDFPRSTFGQSVSKLNRFGNLESGQVLAAMFHDFGFAGRAARLQGDDAARFRADYEAIKSQFPTWPTDQTLAQLWDQGGYSWLAIEEAC